MHMKCKTFIRKIFVILPYFKYVHQFYLKHFVFDSIYAHLEQNLSYLFLYWRHPWGRPVV